ncbi:MAG: zinc-binding dehydrogenase [Chloroflexota bacterium]|nr:zinc-binding dehydrogenase [Chloroflexota bacterium]
MKSVYISFPEAKRVEVREEEVTAPSTNEILCQAEKSLISIGTETFCLRGVFDPGTNWASWVSYPFRPGYSMAARVLSVGADVQEVEKGDRVLASVPHQQFFKVSPERVFPIPDGVDPEEATWGTLANTTQLGVRRGNVALGETVGVVGLGILGQLIIQYLNVLGARKIIAVDTISMRLESAKSHGATHIFHGLAQDAREAVQKITEGKMLDAIWDVTGHPTVLAACVQLLRKRGRVILIGDCPTPTEQYLGPGVVSDSIAILGIHGSSSPPSYSEFTPWTQREMIALFYDYLLQGRMRVSDLITHRHSPTEAAQVYDRLLKDRSTSMGVIFDWSRL